ncbi:unnamed protein product, partial [Prorocentrum cordatum]
GSRGRSRGPLPPWGLAARPRRQRVELRGLQGLAAEHNGSHGMLVSFDAEVGRWAVQLDKGGLTHVWAANVSTPQAAAPAQPAAAAALAPAQPPEAAAAPRRRPRAEPSAAAAGGGARSTGGAQPGPAPKRAKKRVLAASRWDLPLLRRLRRGRRQGADHDGGGGRLPAEARRIAEQVAARADEQGWAKAQALQYRDQLYAQLAAQLAAAAPAPHPGPAPPAAPAAGGPPVPLGGAGAPPPAEAEAAGRPRRGPAGAAGDGGARGRGRGGAAAAGGGRGGGEGGQGEGAAEGAGYVSDESASTAGEDEGDVAWAPWRPVGALPWPDVWSGYNPPRPGQEGFGAYAASCMSRAGLGGPGSPLAGLGLALHQESAAFLLHPASPTQRLLVDHAAGTGKARIMVLALDNYFDDPRPKIAIFATAQARDHFFGELLRWPSRWRHYFGCCCPDQAATASGSKDWSRRRSEVWDLGPERLSSEARRRGVAPERLSAELLGAVREALAMRGAVRRGRVSPALAQAFREDHPGEPVPRAPLRAFLHAEAGGEASLLGPDGRPRSRVLQVGFDARELNPYSGKVLLLQAAQCLEHPDGASADQLRALRGHLSAARGTALAAFSTLPTGRALLDLVKGPEAPSLGDEGSVVRRHTLRGEILKRYLLKEASAEPGAVSGGQRDARLLTYCNVFVHPKTVTGDRLKQLQADPKSHAPKLQAVVKAVSKAPQKAAVLLRHDTGSKVLLEMLRQAGKRSGFRVASADELREFNDPRRNLRGERYRAIVLEAPSRGATTDARLMHVRELHLVDLPPAEAWPELAWHASRCACFGCHAELPEEERTLAVHVHVAQLPKLLRRAVGALVYRELLASQKAADTGGEALEAAAEACVKELHRRKLEDLAGLRSALQAEGGGGLAELLAETALEKLGATTAAPAAGLRAALQRIGEGQEDLAALEASLVAQAQTADERLLAG